MGCLNRVTGFGVDACPEVGLATPPAITAPLELAVTVGGTRMLATFESAAGATCITSVNDVSLSEDGIETCTLCDLRRSGDLRWGGDLRRSGVTGVAGVSNTSHALCLGVTLGLPLKLGHVSPTECDGCRLGPHIMGTYFMARCGQLLLKRGHVRA
jgi:hypothetical protein